MNATRPSWVVGTPRCGVRSAQRAEPTWQDAVATRSCAFTLIEVMVATTIFFMAMFAILGVLSAGVHAATLLRKSGPTAGMVANYFVISNKIDEGSLTGEFDDAANQGYKWVSDAVEITNGLFKMDFVVVDPHGVQYSTLRDVYFYKPGSGSQHMGLNSPR
jgi:hypothetical protein